MKGCSAAVSCRTRGTIPGAPGRELDEPPPAAVALGGRPLRFRPWHRHDVTVSQHAEEEEEEKGFAPAGVAAAVTTSSLLLL
jgi:hypothetical protein